MFVFDQSLGIKVVLLITVLNKNSILFFCGWLYYISVSCCKKIKTSALKAQFYVPCNFFVEFFMQVFS